MNDEKALDSLKSVIQNEVDDQGKLIPNALTVNLLGHIEVYRLVKEYIQLCTDEVNCISADVKMMIHEMQEDKINQLLLYRICSKEVIRELYKTREQMYKGEDE